MAVLRLGVIQPRCGRRRMGSGNRGRHSLHHMRHLPGLACLKALTSSSLLPNSQWHGLKPQTLVKTAFCRQLVNLEKGGQKIAFLVPTSRKMKARCPQKDSGLLFRVCGLRDDSYREHGAPCYTK